MVNLLAFYEVILESSRVYTTGKYTIYLLQAVVVAIVRLEIEIAFVRVSVSPLVFLKSCKS